MMRLLILSILIVSSQATRGLKGLSRQSLRSRILKDNWNDDVYNYISHFEESEQTNNSSSSYVNDTDTQEMIEYQAQEADPTNSSSSSSVQEMIVNRVEKYKEVAESKAWEFYQSSPSEWTESQWDFVFMLFGGLLLVSCCCLSSACAYCCINRRDDKDGPSSNEDRYAKQTWYNRRKRGTVSPDTIESQPTFDSGGSITAMSSLETFKSTTKNEKKESLLKKSEKTMKIKETKGSYESPKNKMRDGIEQSRSISPRSVGDAITS